MVVLFVGEDALICIESDCPLWFVILSYCTGHWEEEAPSPSSPLDHNGTSVWWVTGLIVSRLQIMFSHLQDRNKCFTRNIVKLVHTRNTKCQTAEELHAHFIYCVQYIHSIHFTCLTPAHFSKLAFGWLLSFRANWEYTGVPLPVITMCFDFKSYHRLFSTKSRKR